MYQSIRGQNDYVPLFFGRPEKNKGVGEGGQGGGGGGARAPHFQKWGAQVGLCPPPHFWVEQMF